MSDPRASLPAHDPWWPPTWKVHKVAETASTNEDLVAAARGGAPFGTVLVADHQTAGRGRLDRRWEAPPGSSLLVSMLLPPPPGEGRLHRLTQAMGLAALGACESVAGVHAVLGWPNDVFVGERKLAGILAEAVHRGPTMAAVVVGMGMNVNWPAEIPPHLADRLVSLNHLVGHPIDRDELLAAVLERLTACRWETLGDDYRAHLGTIGRRVDVTSGGRHFAALAVDVTDEGTLVVEHDDGTRESLSAADVTVMR